MSDLRTRIVAAMKERAERDTDWMLADLADAVIRELGLQRDDEYELGCYTPSGRYRYVTEWTTDE